MDLDLSYLKDMAEGNDDLILEMISIFEEQSSDYSNRMRQYYLEGNWKALALLAHKAKPSAAVVGLRQLAEELKELEVNSCDVKDPVRSLAIIEKYDRECKKAAQQLRKIFESV
jgi:HPt (histidine-containing phosphotransfer) domain-containing protein